MFNFMDLLLSYMVFNLLIPTRCETLPNIPTISSSNVSLFHMVVSPLSSSHFQSSSIQLWPLELDHGCPGSTQPLPSTYSCALHGCNICKTHCLAFMHGLTHQEDFRYKGSHVHEFIAAIYLSEMTTKLIQLTTLISIIGQLRGVNIEDIYTNGLSNKSNK